MDLLGAQVWSAPFYHIDRPLQELRVEPAKSHYITISEPQDDPATREVLCPHKSHYLLVSNCPRTLSKDAYQTNLVESDRSHNIREVVDNQEYPNPYKSEAQ